MHFILNFQIKFILTPCFNASMELIQRSQPNQKKSGYIRSINVSEAGIDITTVLLCEGTGPQTPDRRVSVSIPMRMASL
jgi:hypothetical protein